jgi:hypothetical protein
VVALDGKLEESSRNVPILGVVVVVVVVVFACE